MTSIVVDASVVIKWFLPEVHSDVAQHLLQQDYRYFAPDLLFAETANVVWKKVQRGELRDTDGSRLVRDLGGVAIELVTARALMTDAYALAIVSGRTVYDALYLALAIRLKTHLITADERLVNALAGIRELQPHVKLLQA